jgi:hypothetical protein
MHLLTYSGGYPTASQPLTILSSGIGTSKSLHILEPFMIAYLLAQEFDYTVRPLLAALQIEG